LCQVRNFTPKLDNDGPLATGGHSQVNWQEAAMEKSTRSNWVSVALTSPPTPHCCHMVSESHHNTMLLCKGREGSLNAAGPRGQHPQVNWQETATKKSMSSLTACMPQFSVSLQQSNKHAWRLVHTSFWHWRHGTWTVFSILEQTGRL